MTRASFVLIALVAAEAAAQPAPNPSADAAYQEGRRLYDLREWDAAIAKFKEAYRLRPDAPSLFNIAQGNRLKGDCVEALSFYKTYKRNFPGEKNIAKVDKFIADMEACAKAQPVKPEPAIEPKLTGEPKPTGEPTTKPTSNPTGPVGPVSPPPSGDGTPIKQGEPVGPLPAEGSPGRSQRIIGLSVGGVGVVALGASVVFGLRARGAASDAESGTVGSTWDPSIQTHGKTYARNAKISAAVGGALLVTGGVLYVLGRRGAAETNHVAVVPEAGGASLVLSWDH